MTGQHIYLIRQTSEQEGYSGYYDDEEILIEHGFFINKDVAEMKIEEILEPIRARIAEQQAVYDKQLAEWRAEDERLRALGGRHLRDRPYSNVHSLPRLDVVEVDRGY